MLCKKMFWYDPFFFCMHLKLFFNQINQRLVGKKMFQTEVQRKNVKKQENPHLTFIKIAIKHAHSRMTITNMFPIFNTFTNKRIEPSKASNTGDQYLVNMNKIETKMWPSIADEATYDCVGNQYIQMLMKKIFKF